MATRAAGWAAAQGGRLAMRRLAMGLGAAGVAGGAGAVGMANQSTADGANPWEGTKRSMQFWFRAFPPFLHYKWVERRVLKEGLSEAEASKLYAPLHDKYVPVAEELILTMKGFYLKQAQFMGLRDDFLPAQYLEICKKMQDKVPAQFGPGEVRKMIEASFQKELGLKFDDVFESIDDKPLGAASIGQGHAAKLKDGTMVAVKVQYPNIESMFRSDITTTIAFCKLAMPMHVKPMQEIERQFVTEFDYRGEALNLSEIRENMAKHFNHLVYVPRPYPQYCTKQVLVMELLRGTRLDDGIRNSFEAYAKQQGMTLAEFEAKYVQKLKEQTHATSAVDVRSNLKADIEKMKWAKRYFGTVDAAYNSGLFLYNWSVGLVAGQKQYYHTVLPLNLAEIIDVLNKVHAHQILIDGAFNGDPHPGNIMLLNDGRLGLLDYGQVKRLPLAKRLAFAKLIVKLAEEDGSEESKLAVVRAYEEMGMKGKHYRPDIAFRLAAFWNDRDTDDVTMGKNVSQFMDWAEKENPAEELDEDYVMPARVSVVMRGMANAFGIRMRTAPSWKPIAEELLRNHGRLE